MSQWIKQFPIPPIFLSFILIFLYYTVYTGHLLAVLGLSTFLVRLVWLYPVKKWLPSLIILFCFAAFFFFQQKTAEQNFQQEPESADQIIVLPDTIKVNGSSLTFRGKTQGQIYQVFYQLKSEDEQKAFQQLSQQVILDIKGTFSLAEERRNFSGFDYRAYLKTQGIHRILKIEEIKGSQTLFSWNPLDRVSVWRRKALLFIRQHFPDPMRHYMTGLLFGDTGVDFSEMTELYSSLGILHLFALSGMQVGFFVDFFRKALLRLGLKTETLHFLQLPFFFVYAGLTGFSVSVVRSLLQKFLSFCGVTRTDNFALTIMLLAVFMPNFLLTAGGVLSCAYAFIISMLDFENLPKYRKIFMESLTISLGILPILLFYFAEFQPWSILLTFLFSFLFDVFLLPMLTFIFLLSPFLLIRQPNILFQYLEKIIAWLAAMFNRPLVFGQVNVWMLAAMLLLFALVYDFRQQKRIAGAFSILLVLLFFLNKYPLQNEITVIDIGQGDSIFLRDWTGRTVLIDVGGRVEFGQKEKWQKGMTAANAERTLIPYLKSRGVDSLDILVLTHTDTDHVGDMLEVAKHFKVKQVYVSKGSLTQADFVKQLENINSPVHAAEVGDSISIFDSQLQVLYPNDIGDGGNDDSIVLYGQFFQTKFLFTGDLEENGEAALLEQFPQLKVDVLKAGHHGSKGSSSPEFLQSISPKIALISAGKNNRYQHPHQETLDRFEEVSTIVYRTDEQGAIRFKGWNSWQIETVR